MRGLRLTVGILMSLKVGVMKKQLTSRYVQHSWRDQMHLVIKVLLGVVATASVIAVATTGTVYASRSVKPMDDAAISNRVPLVTSLNPA